MANNDAPFHPRQIKDFVKEAKREAGDGWSMLGPRFQHALIAERALYIMGGQASETIKTETLHWLLHAMLVEAGVEST
jgi:hypothetical protein